MQAWIFIDFERISGAHFESFFGHLGPKYVFVFMLVPRSLFFNIFSSVSGFRFREKGRGCIV